MVRLVNGLRLGRVLDRCWLDGASLCVAIQPEMQKESKQSTNPITLTWPVKPGRTLGPVMADGTDANCKLFTSVFTVFLWIDGGAGIIADLTLTWAHKFADLSFPLQTLHVLTFLLGLSCPVFFFFLTLLQCLIDGDLLDGLNGLFFMTHLNSYGTQLHPHSKTSVSLWTKHIIQREDTENANTQKTHRSNRIQSIGVKLCKFLIQSTSWDFSIFSPILGEVVAPSVGHQRVFSSACGCRPPTEAGTL